MTSLREQPPAALPSGRAGLATERRPLAGGINITALGLGTVGVGGHFGPLSNRDAHSTLAEAHDAGINLVDTAPLYGYGLAEQRVGSFLANEGWPGVVLSTKVGRILHPVPAGAPFHFDFSADGVLRSLESSLQRLGVDQVDIVLLHDPDDCEDQALRSAYPELHRLRSEGVVKAIGLGMNHPRIPSRFVRETDVDVVLLAGRYTLLDQSAAQEFLPLCLERGVAVICGGVFNSGVLADPGPGATFDYVPATDEVIARVERIRSICRSFDVSVSAAALQFAGGHPAVRSILVGPTNSAQMRQCLSDFEAPVPDALWSALVDEGLISKELIPKSFSNPSGGAGVS